MNKNIEKRIRKFVEQESETRADSELLAKLREFLAEDTLYWGWPPERRNAFNLFLRDIVDEFIRSTLSGEYGSMVVLESLVVTAFEIGYRLRISEEK